MAKGRINRLAGALRNERGQLVKRGGGEPTAVAADSGPDNLARGVSVDSQPADPTAEFAGDAGNAGDTGGSARRKRRGGWPKGRARGTRPPGEKTPPTLAVSSLQNTLSEIHGLLAALTVTPELALGDDEAKRLATALHDVSKHYRIPVVSPDKMALAVLIWTAGSIYVPKAKAIADRKRGVVVKTALVRSEPSSQSVAADGVERTAGNPAAPTPEATAAAWFPANVHAAGELPN